MDKDTSGRLTRFTVAPLAVLTLALAGCGGSFSAQEEQEDAPFTVGLIAPLTGPASLEGTAMQQGFELGIEKVNETGGLFGQDVEVIVVDDMGDAATSTQVAQRLIREDDVDYIFGTIAGDTSLAVAEVAADAEVPFSTAIDGIVPFCSPHFWPFGVTEPMLLQELVPLMIEEHGPKVAFVGNDYLFPREYARVATELIEQNDAELVVEEYSPLGTSDWQPVVAKMSSADPDWILTAVVGGDAVSFTKQAEQFGLLDDRGYTGVALKQEFYPGVGDTIEGRQVVLPYSDQTPGEENEAFVADYRDTFGVTDPIPGVAATAYTAAQFIAEAVEKAGSREPDAVSEQMADLTFEGLLGTASFDPANHMFSSNMFLIEIGEGGEYRTVRDLGTLSDPQPRECA